MGSLLPLRPLNFFVYRAGAMFFTAKAPRHKEKEFVFCFDLALLTGADARSHGTINKIIAAEIPNKNVC